MSKIHVKMKQKKYKFKNELKWNFKLLKISAGHNRPKNVYKNNQKFAKTDSNSSQTNLQSIVSSLLLLLLLLLSHCRVLMGWQHHLRLQLRQKLRLLLTQMVKGNHLRLRHETCGWKIFFVKKVVKVVGWKLLVFMFRRWKTF